MRERNRIVLLGIQPLPIMIRARQPAHLGRQPAALLQMRVPALRLMKLLLLVLLIPLPAFCQVEP